MKVVWNLRELSSDGEGAELRRKEEKKWNSSDDREGMKPCFNCGLKTKDNYNDKRNSDIDKVEGKFPWKCNSGSFVIKNKLTSSSKRRKITTMMLVTLELLIFLCILSPAVVSVSAVELHPHGGVYHREGGNDFIYTASAQQQQSFFGGGAAGGGADFGDDMGSMMGDMIMTCSRPTKSSRAAKYLAIKQLDIPCDMGDKKSAWCNLPGDKYPWHAVRRFVFENQGLMRRMYGEVRQLSLLRMEFEDDMDDEIEDERHGPPRAPPIPEDHRRNSILTEVLDESLPRVLSETPPEDQILLKDHRFNLLRQQQQQRQRDGESTPRTLSSVSTSSTPSIAPGGSGSAEEDVFEALFSSSTTTAATTTPVVSSGSSEEQLNNNATEVMIGVTLDSLSTGLSGGLSAFDMNGTAAATLTTVASSGEVTATTDTASTPGLTASTLVGRNGLTEEFVVTEEATQESTGAIMETEEGTKATGSTAAEELLDQEAVVTTTEEMLASSLSDQDVDLPPGVNLGEEPQLEVGGAAVVNPIQQQQQQLNFEENKEGATASDNEEAANLGVTSDESSHDFVNLDGNHILYFVDENKKNNGGGGAGAAPGSGYVPPQQGKLKAVNACPVKEEVVAPYWANNTRGEILALLNLYPFEQYIHWERCNHENKQMFCRQGCRCEQQYRLHRLLAFDPTNECRGIFSDWFRFPSCCVCRCYLNEYELMMLNAAGQDNPPPSQSHSSSHSSSAKSRTSDRIRSPRKILLDQLVDGPDVQGVDDMHFFYKQTGYHHEHDHGAQPRKRRSLFPNKIN